MRNSDLHKREVFTCKKNVSCPLHRKQLTKLDRVQMKIYTFAFSSTSKEKQGEGGVRFNLKIRQ